MSLKEKGKLSSIFAGVASNTPILFATGDLILALHMAGPTGVAVNVGVVAATVGGKVYENVTGKKIGLGFYTLGLVQAVTGFSVVAKGLQSFGPAALLALQGTSAEALKVSRLALSFLLATAAMIFAGRQHARQEKPKGILDTPETHLGLSGVALTLETLRPSPSYIPTALLGLGLAKLFGKKTDPAQTQDNSWRALYNKHASPSRLYGLAFVTGALLSLKDPFYAAAYCLWAGGYMFLDEDRSKGAFSDIMNKFRKPRPAAAPL